MILRVFGTATALLVLLGRAGEAHACSFVRFPDRREPSATYFLGTARPDTLPAGPGQQIFYPRQEASGSRGEARSEDPVSAPEHPIYGQVVSISRIGGRAADQVRGAAARFHGEVVVVPWSYRADCRPIAWSGSARWLRPGAEAMYIARLREPKYWVGGRPTFDVLASRQPYPEAAVLAHLPDATPEPALSAGEYFELYEALPDPGALDKDSDGALRAVRAWVAMHPQLASREPVWDVVSGALSTAEYARVARILPPMTGTYRATVTPWNGVPRTLFIRTSATPTPWFGPQEYENVRRGGDPLDFHGAEGYRLRVHGAPSPEQIVSENGEALRQPCSVSGLTVASPPSRTRSGARQWRANLDWGMMARCFPGDTEIARGVAAYGAQVRNGSWERLPGLFRQDTDGTVHFEQVIYSEGRMLLHIQAERISEQSVP